VQIPSYSFGFGDRFSLHGNAFISAIQEMEIEDKNIFPVWNKSHTEFHRTGDSPQQMKDTIEHFCVSANWQGKFAQDADHVTLENIDEYVNTCDYFTIDVSGFIRKLAHYDEMDTFIKSNQKYIGRLEVPGMKDSFQVFENVITSYAGMYLLAAKKAGELYQYILEKRKGKPFITEISMDEVNYSHSPLELFFILNALAFYKVDFQLISPKFIGRFNKNIEYVGKVEQFEAELDMYMLIMKFAIQEFGLNKSLKLSLHTGSDKFSIFPIIKKMLKKHNSGIHIKTSGIGWLTSLSVIGKKGKTELDLIKSFYQDAYHNFSDIITHFDKVTDINKNNLPEIDQVMHWNGEDFEEALTISASNKKYNPTFRQFMSCAYGVVDKNSEVYKKVVNENIEEINEQIKTELVASYLKPLFS